MDKLKKYLEQHRSEMDVDLPPRNVLQDIQAADGGQKVARRLPLVMRYAAVVLLITMGATVWLITTKKDEKQVAQTAEKDQPVQNQTPIENSNNDKENSSNDKESFGTNAVKSPEASENPFTSQQTAVKPDNTSTQKKKRRHQSKQVIDAALIDKNYSNLISYQIQRLRTTPVYVESPEYFIVFVKQLAQIEKDERVTKADIEKYGLKDQLLESLIDIYEQKLNLLKRLQKEIRKMNNSIDDGLNKDTLHPYYLNI